MQYTVKNRIWIEANGTILLGPGRVLLLKAIEENGSLSKAAKALSMSYKKAWRLMDAINKAAEETVVITATGGKDGGGAKLTNYGKELIVLFDTLSDSSKNHLKEESLKMNNPIKEDIIPKTSFDKEDITTDEITGFVLIGGKSSRMGETKGLLAFNNKSFVQHSIDALAPLVSSIVLVGDLNCYNDLGLKRIPDIIKDAGPVAAIYAALTDATTEYNLVLSCDIPLINTASLQLLINNIDPKADVVQLQSKEKTMPLIAIYKKQCAPILLDLLQNGERRLRKALTHLKVTTVTLETALENSTDNINTPLEYKLLTDDITH